MGGIGSGRWPRKKHGTVESVPRISIRELVRGSMPSEQAWLLSWRRKGTTETVLARAERDGILVLYGVNGSAWARVTWTACNYGGRRAWFECPGCFREVLHLYLPGLQCRDCTGLTYGSRREGRADRQLRRAWKIRGRVGGSGSLLAGFPPKPSGMHWRTYHRLREADAKATKAYLGHAVAVIDRLEKRVGRAT